LTKRKVHLWNFSGDSAGQEWTGSFFTSKVGGLSTSSPPARLKKNKRTSYTATVNILTHMVKDRCQTMSLAHRLSANYSRSHQRRIWSAQMHCWWDRQHNHDVTVATNVKLMGCLRTGGGLLTSSSKCAFQLLKRAVDETVSRLPTDRELRTRSVGGISLRVGTDHYDN